MGENTDFCRAVSQPGSPVTAYVGGRAFLHVVRQGGPDLVCTQDGGHQGGHSACDGAGHVLARWPRVAAERFWEKGDCDGHDHG
jgi:hypothetical protein